MVVEQGQNGWEEPKITAWTKSLVQISILYRFGQVSLVIWNGYIVRRRFLKIWRWNRDRIAERLLGRLSKKSCPDPTFKQNTESGSDLQEGYRIRIRLSRRIPNHDLTFKKNIESGSDLQKNTKSGSDLQEKYHSGSDSPTNLTVCKLYRLKIDSVKKRDQSPFQNTKCYLTLIAFS